MFLLRWLKDPKQIILSLNHKGFFHFLSDRNHAKLIYYASFGKPLSLISPITFNEKIQWLKLFDRNPLYTKLVDKYSVKDIVAGVIGEEYIIPTLGMWERFEDIEFQKLPEEFVLKTTHDGGGSGVVICRSKSHFDYNEARKIIEKSLKRDVYKDLREWPYKDVPHRIIAEKYLRTPDGVTLEDYKIHCFNGVSKFILVCRDRYGTSGLTEDFFSIRWEHLELKRPKHPNSSQKIPCPKELPLMLELAEKLSEKIPFVRVDFYVYNGKVFFGELTFYPTSGFTRFVPDSYDTEIGSWLELPK